MIGSALKKLANENNMNIDKGVAYGNFRGYAVTLSEGAGYKLICITTVFKDPQQQFQLQTVLNGKDLNKEYRLQQVTFTEKGIFLNFFDNPGTMKKLEAFLDYFFPLLDTYGASKYNICTECGTEIVSGQWKLIDTTAYYFHEACAHSVKQQLAQDAENRKNEDTGSYSSGFVGALLGSVLGAILWAVLWVIGYIASVIGLVIGILSEKFYNKFNGKQSKGKVWILVFCGILGVVLGTIIGELFTLFMMIANGELYGFVYADIPYIYIQLLADSAYVASLLGSIGMGLIFALLGMISRLVRTKREVTDITMVDLK